MDRRAFTLGALAASGAVLPDFGAARAARPLPGGLQTGFVGCYTTGQGPADLGVHPEARGIYSFQFDPRGGKLLDLQLAAECPSPTNLLAAPQNGTLYAAQGGNFAKGQGAMWRAYRVEGRSLRLLNSISAGGTGPTHGMVDRRGRFLVTTNFSSNEVMAYRLGRDGSLLEPTARIAPSGSGAAAPPPPGTALPPMAEACHTTGRSISDNCRTKPHIALFSPRERWVVVAEIATDAIAVYRFDAISGAMTLHQVAGGQPGGGPRHLAFSPDGRFLFSSDEHGSAVSAWAWDEARGQVRHLQHLSTLPAGYSGPNTTAHIAIHPSGRALWVSNRGSQTIAAFRVDPASGRLTAAGHAPTGGRDVWCFGLDRSGQWLVAGNVSGDFLTAYRIDPASARLVPVGPRLSASFPTCIAFWR